MASPLVNVTVRTNAQVALAKLARVGPKILATNQLLATQILDHVKEVVYLETPLGPGHFGYHGRDTLKVKVTSKGNKTTGVLLGAVQLRWREFGTYRQRAFYTAHKALGAVKGFLKVHYGGTANWWPK